MNTLIVNTMLHHKLNEVFGGAWNPMQMSGMLPTLSVTTHQSVGFVSSANYDASNDEFGSGFPEHTTVYPLLYANAPYVGFYELKRKINLYDQGNTNNGVGLVVYREEVWSLILEKAVQTVLPFLKEHIDKALLNMRTTLDSIVCLEDDDEEMVDWTVDNRGFMNIIINAVLRMSESLTKTSWDDRIGILELYADLKYYAEMLASYHYKQESTSSEWNRDALLLLRWNRYICTDSTTARTPLMGWKTWGGDAKRHLHEEQLRSVVQNAYKEVLEEENKSVQLCCTQLQSRIIDFMQFQTARFKDDMLISCFKQIQSLTLTVNKLCEKLQIAGQVLSF